MTPRPRPTVVLAFTALACLTALAAPATAQEPAAAAKPLPQVSRVLIVSIDGLRPDIMLRSPAPNLRQLVDTGAYSFWARTTDIAVTLPSHCSMLTGVPPDKHGIFWNDKPPAAGPTRPSYPTLIELAKQAGYSTALVAGKAKFDALGPGADWAIVPDKTVPTTQVAEQAVDIIRRHKPQVMVLHLPGVDSAGHKDGWGSPQQVEQIRLADEGVGAVLAALRERNVLDQTFVLVSADHGGAGRNHGKDDVRSRFIPWIANGPGVVRGRDLTHHRELNIRTEDTFATACWVLGITPPRPVEGKPVTQIVEQDELLQPAPATAPAVAQPAAGAR